MLLIFCLSLFYNYRAHGLLNSFPPSKSYRVLHRYLSHNTGSTGTSPETAIPVATGAIGTISIYPDGIARNESLAAALAYLSKYDKEYIDRMAEGRRIGLGPRTVEFKRAQTLKKAGMLK